MKHIPEELVNIFQRVVDVARIKYGKENEYFIPLSEGMCEAGVTVQWEICDCQDYDLVTRTSFISSEELFVLSDEELNERASFERKARALELKKKAAN